ncbi:SusC/RagA family TonB-linked outer membrane protein [Ferruginibacter profundus]
MRKIKLVMLLLFFNLAGALAQTHVVSGKVIDNDGAAVPSASILVSGTKTGVNADVNGAYTIRVKDGAILLISATGFKDVSVNVGNQTSITTVLEKTGTYLKEVVVTGAFNTKRTARSTASGVQTVSAEQLNVARVTNVNNALAGKVAGVQVRSQSGAALGKAPVVRLRGENGLLPGAGALYVVDGTIMPASTDIIPDDVEDISVLQGPAASALFGPQGKNGAIVVTTKKGKKNNGVGIEINSGVKFDNVYILPDYQNSYAGGGTSVLNKYSYKPGDPEGWKALDGKYYPDYEDDASWGPRMNGQEYIPWYAWYGGHERAFKTTSLVAQPNNAKDFYQTGVTKTNNFSFSKAADNYNLRASYTNLDIRGVVPNSYLKRNSLNLNTSVDLSSKWMLSANVNYLAELSNSEDDDGYGNQTTGSFNSWFHRDLDMGILKELRNLRSPDGSVLASWNLHNPASYDASNPNATYRANYWYNFYSFEDNISNTFRKDRLSGDIGLTYKFNNDLKIKATYRKNQLTTFGESIYKDVLQNSGVQTSVTPYELNSNKAAYGTTSSFSNRQNYELLATYTKKLREFALNANAGVDILKTQLKQFQANTMGGLSYPDLYSLENSVNPITNALRGDGAKDYKEQSTQRGMFVRADVGYRNFAFLEGSYRRDYLSTQPASNPYIDSKSFGASFVFSDLIKSKKILSFGKLRASWGEVVEDLAIYRLGTYYTLGTQWLGNILMSEPNSIVSPSLTGAVNTEKEIGIDLRFLKNRIGFSATYWDRTNKDFPVTVSTSQTGGYTSFVTNAGEIAKKGVELTFNVKPVMTKNFQWDINATWGRLIKNEVVSIYPGIPRLTAATGSYAGSYAAYLVNEPGKPWGEMFGTGIKKINGVPQLDANGLYLRQADVDFGSALPDYTGGVQNTFTVFNNFLINFNIDYSHGGKFFSLSDFWGTQSGLMAKTATLNDKGNSVRDAVENGGGVHVFGVDATGKPMDKYVDAFTYYHQFVNNQINEASIYDLTFVKLREVSVGYKIPVEKMGLSKYIKNATFSIVSNNTWLIYAKQKGFDPSEISNTYGENGQYPGTRSLGVNLKVGF